MRLKGKIFKFMSDFLKDGSYYKLYTQAKSTSACGLPKGFFLRCYSGDDDHLNKLPMLELLYHVDHYSDRDEAADLRAEDVRSTLL